MKLLLDTHVYLWWLEDPAMISEPARIEIANGRNTVYVSAVSALEIAIKRASGKLECPDEALAKPETYRFTSLPLSHLHAVQVGSLPMHHRDPFDRLLVAQAMLEQLTLITRDRMLSHYSIPTLAA